MDLPAPPSGSAIIRSVGETEARLRWKISRLRADRLHLLVAALLLGGSVLVVWLSGVLELSLVLVLPSAFAAVVGLRMLRPALREGVVLRNDSLTVMRTPNRLFRGHGFTWESVYPKHPLGSLGHLAEARDKMYEEDLEELRRARRLALPKEAIKSISIARGIGGRHIVIVTKEGSIRVGKGLRRTDIHWLLGALQAWASCGGDDGKPA